MLVYNPKNVVSPGRSSEKICHVMNAKGTDFVLENYDRMSKNLPEDYPFDINGKSINLKKLVIKAFQRSRPTAVAVNAFAVGTHMEAYPEASSTYVVPVRQQQCQAALTQTVGVHDREHIRRQVRHLARRSTNHCGRSTHQTTQADAGQTALAIK